VAIRASKNRRLLRAARIEIVRLSLPPIPQSLVKPSQRAAQVEIECFPLWIGEGVNDGNGVGPGRIRAQIRVEAVIQIDRLGAS
jgi:hypothetical protein